MKVAVRNSHTSHIAISLEKILSLPIVRSRINKIKNNHNNFDTILLEMNITIKFTKPNIVEYNNILWPVYIANYITHTK